LPDFSFLANIVRLTYSFFASGRTSPSLRPA